jgi:hypothetical protein
MFYRGGTAGTWAARPILRTRRSLSERQRSALIASAVDASPPVRRRGPRVCLLPSRRRGGGRGRPDRPRVRDRAVPRGRRESGGPDRSRAGVPYACRPRLRSRPAGSGARRARLGSRSRRGRLRARRAPRRRRDRRWVGHRPHDPHPRAPPGALLLPRGRSPVHRGLALRRHGGSPRPRRGGQGGRGGAVPQPATAPRAVRRRAGVSRSRRGLAVRNGHELRPIDHDRRRTPGQSAARAHNRGRIRRRDVGRLDAAPAEHGADRRAEPRPLPRGRSPAPAGRDRRRSSTFAPPTTSPPATFTGP